MRTNLKAGWRPAWLGACLLVLLPWAAGVRAEVPAAAAESVRVCTKCHDETDAAPVLSILKSKHATVGDPRTPFAEEACVTCHGKSEDHVRKAEAGAERAAPDIVYEGPRASPTKATNALCMTCHEGGLRMH